MSPLGPRAAGAHREGLKLPHASWHDRGYLPHFDAADIWQFITYRLADSMPRQVARTLADELGALPVEERDAAYRKRVEGWLNAGHGACWLARPDVAEIIAENWRHFAGTRYDLGAWVIMPNHVHLLIRIRDGHPLEKIIRSWKSYTAKRIMDLTGCGSPVWWNDYWDRFIRDDGHYSNTWRYIEENPVSAGLVGQADAWRWGSAYGRRSERASGARSQEAGT